MICFWLAIHFERILIVQFLFENYDFAKTILRNLREQGKEDLEQKANRDEANWRKSQQNKSKDSGELSYHEMNEEGSNRDVKLGKE